jgi:S1-C subfamily serine protease
MSRPTAVLLLLLSSAGCTYQARPLPVGSPLGEKDRPQVIFTLSEKAKVARLAAFVIDTPMGYEFGEYAWGHSGHCSEHQKWVNTTGRMTFEVEKYFDVFNAAVRSHGYPVDEQTSLFKDSDARVPELQVAARVVEAAVNECYPRHSTNKLKGNGNAVLKIEWSIYSSIEKKVVLTLTTVGSTYQNVETSIGDIGILRVALADATHRLAELPAYRSLIDPPAGAAAGVNKQARHVLKRAKVLTGGVQGNMETIKRAVATVHANKGSGTGFAISNDGAFVTAAHVVAGSRLVKVTTGAGKECYGEVVASDLRRDLALIRLDCTELTALPLSTKKAVEGSDAYAIGSPLSEKILQLTVTRGIVSGVRSIEGLQYIQSDVSILPGGSGGPLLDGSGNVMGLAVKGLTNRATSGDGSVPLGVNLFVPVDQLELFLPIEFE